MKHIDNYSPLQKVSLVLLRYIIGWHLFYEGISKIMNPGWTSIGFLKESQWFFSDLASWIISNGKVIQVVDILNTWGLIVIGAGLILGLFSTLLAYSGAFLLMIYYFNNAPLIGMEYSMPAEGNYLIVNKILIEALTLFVLALFPTGSSFGLDYFRLRLSQKNIDRSPLLENH